MIIWKKSRMDSFFKESKKKNSLKQTNFAISLLHLGQWTCLKSSWLVEIRWCPTHRGHTRSWNMEDVNILGQMSWRQWSAREDWGQANVWCANFYTSPDSFIVVIDFLAWQKMHHCLVCWFQTVAPMARIHPSPEATLQRGYSLAVGVCRLCR